MWSLALSSLRFRWVSFVGVFVTVVAAAALVTATGSLLEAGIRGATAPDRFAGADIIVAADQTVSEERGTGEDRETVHSTVAERIPLRGVLADDVATVPGVARVLP